MSTNHKSLGGGTDVETIHSKETQLHGLVNNGGIMAVPDALSKDGFESQFAVRFLAKQRYM